MESAWDILPTIFRQAAEIIETLRDKNDSIQTSSKEKRRNTGATIYKQKTKNPHWAMARRRRSSNKRIRS